MASSASPIKGWTAGSGHHCSSSRLHRRPWVTAPPDRPLEATNSLIKPLPLWFGATNGFLQLILLAVCPTFPKLLWLLLPVSHRRGFGPRIKRKCLKRNTGLNLGKENCLVWMFGWLERRAGPGLRSINGANVHIEFKRWSLCDLEKNSTSTHSKAARPFEC